MTSASLSLLVRAADGEQQPIPDVRTREKAAAAGPWVLATLHAVGGASSFRDAARVLHVHHSALQDRLSHAESVLGLEPSATDRASRGYSSF